MGTKLESSKTVKVEGGSADELDRWGWEEDEHHSLVSKEG